MERFFFLPAQQIDFIPIKENKNYIPPKNCHICNVELGSLGLVRASRKVCFFCKRIFCKKCTSRKVTENKRRVCQDCYSSALTSFFESQMMKKLESNLSTLELELKTSQDRVKVLENQRLVGKVNLDSENKQAGSNKTEEKLYLLNLLEKVKQQKNSCNRARAKVSPLEQQLVSLEKTFQELGKEVYEGQKTLTENLEVFNCLKENLATSQDLNESLLNRFKQKTTQAAHSDQGFQIRSMKDLKKLKKVKDKEMNEIIQRKQEFVEELEEIEREIALYTKHKSCRHSGIFQ